MGKLDEWIRYGSPFHPQALQCLSWALYLGVVDLDGLGLFYIILSRFPSTTLITL